MTTNHITNDVSTLNNISEYTGTSTVSMGNGDSVPIAHIGSAGLFTGNRLLNLKNVLHVPNMCKNLISFGQFAKDNKVYFEFHPFHCFVKDIQTGVTLLVGHIHNGLYRFDTKVGGHVDGAGLSDLSTGARSTGAKFAHHV